MRLFAACALLLTVTSVKAQQLPPWDKSQRMRPNPVLDAMGPHQSQPAWRFAGLAYAHVERALKEVCSTHETAFIDAQTAQIQEAQVIASLERFPLLKNEKRDGISLQLRALPDGNKAIIAFQSKPEGLSLFTCLACSANCQTSRCMGLGGRSGMLSFGGDYWFELKQNLESATTVCEQSRERIQMTELEQQAAARQRELEAQDLEATQSVPAIPDSSPPQIVAPAIEKAERANRIAAIRQKPGAWRFAMSATICWAQRRKADALTVIARERQGAKLGGVVDLSLLHSQQLQAQAADDHKSRALRKLKALKLSSIACTDPRIAALSVCLDHLAGELSLTDDGSHGHCRRLDYGDLAELAAEN